MENWGNWRRKKEKKEEKKNEKESFHDPFRAFQSRIEAEERNVDRTRVTGAERGCVLSQRRMNRGAGVIYRWFGKMALPPGESGESRNTVYALVDNESPSQASVGYQRVCHQMQLVCKRDRAPRFRNMVGFEARVDQTIFLFHIFIDCGLPVSRGHLVSP